MQDYLKGLELPGWAKGEVEEAVRLGITDGGNPCQLVPRYQADIMALRAVKNLDR